MHECGKATLRRLYHGSAYARYFAGHGIDIGSRKAQALGRGDRCP